MKSFAQNMLVSIARNIPLVSSAAYFVTMRTSHKGTYPYYRQMFIENGSQSRCDSRMRAKIVDRFEAIDRQVPKASTAMDGLVLAEALLSVEGTGDIVECGCFAGASSAKLSILAQILEKNLVIFDSFEGLPEGGERAVHARRKVKDIKKGWRPGDYSAGLEAVQKNIEAFGEISVCSFVQGWFNQTLNEQNLPKRVIAAFTDVDLQSSARDCLISIWPRLCDGGIFFSHDVAFITVLQQLVDEDLWINQLKSFPPIFFGAGFGVCDLSPHLGYMVKGTTVTAEYLKNLTLNK
jgi:hypothetical protein